jgi:cation diffusion facilitator family transporter
MTTQKVAAARLSIYSNTALTLLKLVVGALSGSVSVLSEAAHSASDLLASWIAFFAVRIADRPADEDHPYGHGKVENLSGMAEAILIFAAAAWVIYEAVAKLKSHEPPVLLPVAIAVMAVSSVVNVLVASHLFRVAAETDSQALEADAEHLRTDVYTSAGVMVGLVLVHFTALDWLDPVIGILVALIILHASWRLTRGALNPLMDTTLPEADVLIVRKVLEDDPRVLAFHKLRTRKSGSSRHVDAHILLEDELSLVDAHDLTEELEDRMREQLPNAEITLHMEPYRRERQHQYERHGGPPPEEIDSSTAG